MTVGSAVRTGLGTLSRRSNLLFGVLDQGVSSLTNFGLSFAVAANSSEDAFGALGLVVALYLLEYGIVHGAIVEPYSVGAGSRHGDARRHAVAAAVVVGLALGGAHLGGAAVTDGALARFLLVYGIATPALVVQYSARGLAIAEGRVRVAFESNVLWAAVQLALSVLAMSAGSSLGLLGAWCAGGAVSGVYCLSRLGVGVRVRGWREWFRGRVRLSVSWAADYLAQQGMAQVMVFGLGGVAGLDAVASYRGALLLSGPATVVVEGLRQVVMPGAAWRARAGVGHLRHFIGIVAVGLPTATFVLTGPFLLVPAHIGEQVLGASWEGAREVLPWVILMRLASSIVTALSIGMRATHDRRATLALRLIGGASSLVAATVAGAEGGALGASAAMALVDVALVLPWTVAFLRRTDGRRWRPATAASREPEPDTASSASRPPTPR